MWWLACGKWDLELAKTSSLRGMLTGQGLTPHQFLDRHPLRRLEPLPDAPPVATAEEMRANWAAVRKAQRGE